MRWDVDVLGGEAVECILQLTLHLIIYYRVKFLFLFIVLLG